MKRCRVIIRYRIVQGAAPGTVQADHGTQATSTAARPPPHVLRSAAGRAGAPRPPRSAAPSAAPRRTGPVPDHRHAPAVSAVRRGCRRARSAAARSPPGPRWRPRRARGGRRRGDDPRARDGREPAGTEPAPLAAVRLRRLVVDIHGRSPGRAGPGGDRSAGTGVGCHGAECLFFSCRIRQRPRSATVTGRPAGPHPGSSRDAAETVGPSAPLTQWRSTAPAAEQRAP